jgi:excisionase family DNA binding protein
MRAHDTGGDALGEPHDPVIERLLRPDEVAALLGIPLRTIYRWRSRHEGPRGYRIGRHVRYRIDDVERWLEAHRDVH